jgi:hypothetical protein
MLKKSLFVLLIIFLLTPNVVLAKNQSINPVAQNISYARTIIVQTDDEQAVGSHEITCQQIPKTLGIVPKNEIIEHQLTTNNKGEAIFNVKNDGNYYFVCSSTQTTTQDYCWYFPINTLSFDIYAEAEKNNPVYLVGLASPDTCGQEFSQEQLKAGIDELLPQGTPLPYTNKNIQPPVVTPEALVSDQNDQPQNFWQWLISFLKSIF